MTSVLSRSAVAAILILSLIMGGCQKTKVTEENFAQIKTGMTLKEVENLLGGKGDDQTSDPGFSIGAAGIQGGNSNPDKVYVWKSKDLQIVVTCKDGKVVLMQKKAI
jgi:hypothetical protein